MIDATFRHYCLLYHRVVSATELASLELEREQLHLLNISLDLDRPDPTCDVVIMCSLHYH